MIRLDASTVLLQWATGGLFFLWFTARRNEVGKGYGWLLRGSFSVIAAGSVWAGVHTGSIGVREVAAMFVVVISIVTIKRQDVRIDLIAPAIGLIGVVAGALDAADGAGSTATALARAMVGTFFLGAVSDAMLLGHWYLVQPGMPRKLLNEIVDVMLWLLPFEALVMLIPTGMVSVINGSIDDGWNGMLGWFWIACVITTQVLVIVTKAALKERSYSAVMAATGLMYLAILTAFGTDLVARATLA